MSQYINLDRIFDLHPVTPGQGELMGDLRTAYKSLASVVIAVTTGSPEQTRAINALDESLRLAIAAVIREGK